MILGSDGKNRVLNILIFINFSFIQRLIEVRRVIVLISDANSNELCDCLGKEILC